MEMVLISAGGSSAIDMVSISEKGRHQVGTCEVELTSTRRDEAVRLFTRINLRFVVRGEELFNIAVERAVSLSAEKFCPVALILGQAVDTTHSVEVIAE